MSTDISGNDLRSLEAGGYAEAVGQFAASAFADGPAAAAYGSFGSPIGQLTAVVTHRGVVAIGFDTEPMETILNTVAKKISPAIVDLASAVEPVRRQLDDYFKGSLQVFTMSIDRSLLTPFQTKVLAATDAIPSGEVRSYGQIAAAAGRPKGAQATGQALGANPIPVVIPCHRVVASDGSLRGYAGGLDKKEYLLNLERGTATLF